MKLSIKGYNLVLEFECGGSDGKYYNKYLKNINFPGGFSGPTCGIGIDLSFYKKEEINKMFWDYFDENDLNLLYGAIGQNGEKGKEYTKKIKHLSVEWEKALDIFNKFTIPKFYNGCINTFPGFEDLHEDCQGALFSYCYNRGFSLKGDSRKEVWNITKLTPKKDYEGIASEILKSKRLWGEDQKGLLKRRDAEATLIRSCV